MKVDVYIVSRGIEADNSALRDVWRSEGRSGRTYHTMSIGIEKMCCRC